MIFAAVGLVSDVIFTQTSRWVAGPSSFCHLITMDQPIKSEDSLSKNMWKKQGRPLDATNNVNERAA
jgi:hypothetical protein